MKRLKLLLLLPFLFGFTLTWQNPTTNTNGTPLTDLATIRIYQSPTAGTYGTPLAEIPANGPGLMQSYTAASPERGKLYWVVRACDSTTPIPNCSGPTNEVSRDFLDETAPAVPGGLSVTE